MDFLTFKVNGVKGHITNDGHCLNKASLNKHRNGLQHLTSPNHLDDLNLTEESRPGMGTPCWVRSRSSGCFVTPAACTSVD